MNIQDLLHDDHDTDKNHEGGHSYGPFYEQLFNEYDRQDKLTILELGVQNGGSLRAWKEYFPNADVYGVDIAHSRLPKYELDDVTYIVKDLRDAIKDLEHLKFDIIIDDSDHSENTMAWIAGNYFPLLKEKGTLVFEDVQVPEIYWQKISEAMPTNAVMEAYDYRHIKGRPDDFIITLKHD